jgi:D-alanine-D-alanine ligase
LGCRGAARVDFMMANEEAFYCIEINTIPGMTATSLLPKAAAAAGIPFEDLVEMILLDADLDK